MKLRIMWEGGGWESDEFETSAEWYGREHDSLVAARSAAGAPPLEDFELVGGTQELRALAVALRTQWWHGAGAPDWVPEDTFAALHEGYRNDTDAVLMLHLMDNECPDDWEELERQLRNEDHDEGVVYDCRKSEDSLLVAQCEAMRWRYHTLPEAILQAVNWPEVVRVEGSLGTYSFGDNHYAVDSQYNPNY